MSTKARIDCSPSLIVRWAAALIGTAMCLEKKIPLIWNCFLFLLGLFRVFKVTVSTLQGRLLQVTSLVGSLNVAVGLVGVECLCIPA